MEKFWVCIKVNSPRSSLELLSFSCISWGGSLFHVYPGVVRDDNKDAWAFGLALLHEEFFRREEENTIALKKCLISNAA